MSRHEVEVVAGTTASGEDRPPWVRECPHGPTLVRGASELHDDNGTHRVDRPVVAVCRCGKSALRPWCDSTHRAVPGY